ncbi:hypothetical protein V6L77_20595 [Pannonibacter sp. Pt2-lr]
MSTGAALAGDQGRGRKLMVPASRISAAALWVAVFLGGFVIQEPAPYELFMAGLLMLWLLFGLRLRPEFGPLTVLLILFMAGGTMAVPFARDVPTAAMYMAVSGFLAATAIFYAAVVSTDPSRLFLIERAYIASALLCASIGIAAYFRLFPGSEIFTLYGRARGTFQDPNVFGPFLVLPTVLLVHRLLTRGLFSSPAALLILPVLVLGIFLSFSRGAWGLLALSGVIVYLLSLIHERRPGNGCGWCWWVQAGLPQCCCFLRPPCPSTASPPCSASGQDLCRTMTAPASAALPAMAWALRWSWNGPWSRTAGVQQVFSRGRAQRLSEGLHLLRLARRRCLSAAGDLDNYRSRAPALPSQAVDGLCPLRFCGARGPCLDERDHRYRSLAPLFPAARPRLGPHRHPQA